MLDLSEERTSAVRSKLVNTMAGRLAETLAERVRGGLSPGENQNEGGARSLPPPGGEGALTPIGERSTLNSSSRDAGTHSPLQSPLLSSGLRSPLRTRGLCSPLPIVHLPSRTKTTIGDEAELAKTSDGWGPWRTACYDPHLPYSSSRFRCRSRGFS